MKDKDVMPTTSKTLSSVSPPAYPETEKSVLRNKQHPANRPRSDSKYLELMATSAEASACEMPGWDGVSSSACASPRLGESELIELPPSKAARCVDGLGELPGDLQGSRSSTPISPLTPTSTSSQWDGNHVREGDVSPIEGDFSLSQQLSIPRQQLPPRFEFESQTATDATQQIGVTPAQGSVLVSTASADQQQAYSPERFDHHEHGMIAGTTLREPHAVSPLGLVNRSRPFSAIFSPWHDFPDIEFDTEATDFQHMQDVGFTPSSPTRFREADPNLIDTFVNNTAYLSCTQSLQNQTLSELPAEDFNSDGCLTADASFESTFDGGNNANQENYFSTVNNAPTESSPLELNSWMDFETASNSDSSSTFANAPALSPTSTTTALNSPFTPTDIQFDLQGRAPDSPLFHVDNVDQWANDVDYQPWINPDMVSAYEYSPAREKARTFTATPQTYDRAPPHPVEMELDAAPAASKGDTRKCKNHEL